MIEKLARTYPIEETIVVAGSPRSGTTWLGGIVSQLAGYRHRDEPLDLQNSATLQEAGFSWRTYLSPDGRYPTHRDILYNILTGKTPEGKPNVRRFNRISDIFRQVFEHRVVVKFIRANRLLRWVGRCFDVRAILLIIRHPCAVVSSQLRYENSPWKDQKPPPEGQIAFEDHLPDFILQRFGDILASLRTTEELLAAMWSLDQYFPLCETEKPFPGQVIPYEKLLLDERSELHRIFEYLSADLPPDIETAFSRPSHSASDDLRTHDRQSQLAKWKDHLSGRQIDDILRVVRAFGLDAYSRDPTPNYNRLVS